MSDKLNASDFRTWLSVLADASATLPASEVLARLPEAEGQEVSNSAPAPNIELTWREKLWLVPSETRLGVHEVCEALDRSPSWLYRDTSPKALSKADVAPIPHRKLEGELTFVAGELRTWVRDNEESLHELPSTSTPGERTLLKVVGS